MQGDRQARRAQGGLQGVVAAAGQQALGPPSDSANPCRRRRCTTTHACLHLQSCQPPPFEMPPCSPPAAHATSCGDGPHLPSTFPPACLRPSLTQAYVLENMEDIPRVQLAREIRLHSMCHHNNIVQFYAAFVVSAHQVMSGKLAVNDRMVRCGRSVARVQQAPLAGHWQSQPRGKVGRRQKTSTEPPQAHV